ncbi:hypothetical protein SAMN04488004_11833 [Loktanella salsilacus]|uniref:Uncharacterized protein n=1 Tax=Loktanella salsilacus TaxID=195913 RepID=A0A1I4HM17_9RHOB|nr:hypothetical protein SAMN04488004_11833 [Loktanella salsilacus]
MALRPGGYKSGLHSIGLFVSKYANVPVSHLGRDEGRAFPETTPPAVKGNQEVGGFRCREKE